MPKTNGKITEEYRDESGKFLPGNPGGGRPKNSENFATKWFKAIEKIADANGITADEIEQQLLLVGYKKAKEGDYQFYRDVFDRVYGKPQQHLDMSTLGKQFPIPIYGGQSTIPEHTSNTEDIQSEEED